MFQLMMILGALFVMALTKGAPYFVAVDVLVWLWWVDPVVVSFIYLAALFGLAAAFAYPKEWRR